MIDSERLIKGIKGRISNNFQLDASASSIFKNMALLASGTMAARVVGLATVPLITRIYTPDHMGVLSVFASMMALLMPLGTLRYSAAIPLPKNDGVAVNLVALCLCSLAGISLLSGLFLWLLGSRLFDTFSMRELHPYWWLVVVALVGAGFYEVLSAWATRNKLFKPLARTKVWQSLASALAKIGLGLLGFKPMGLLVGHIVSQAGGCTSLASSFYSQFKDLRKRISRRRVFFVFRRYADFFKFRLPSQFLLAFSGSAPLLFAASLFGKDTAGQLGLALTTLALPIGLFGTTTGQAYYAEIARIGRKNPAQIRKVTIDVTRKLFLVSLFPFLVLLLAGPWMFSAVFGEAWREAGVFASILAIYLLAQFVSSPIVNVFNVFEKQKMFLWINVLRATLMFIVFFIASIALLSPNLTLMVYAFTMAFHYYITYILVNKIINNAINL